MLAYYRKMVKIDYCGMMMTVTLTTIVLFEVQCA